MIPFFKKAFFGKNTSFKNMFEETKVIKCNPHIDYSNLSCKRIEQSSVRSRINRKRGINLKLSLPKHEEQ